MLIHVEVPEEGNDVRFRYDKVVRWNPPLPLGTRQFMLDSRAFPGLQMVNVS